jgi:telomerase protein component 1
MKYKFPAFDAYQLGKYNKEGKIKRKAKKAKNEKAEKDKGKKQPGKAPDSDSEGDNDDEAAGDKKPAAAEPIKKRDLTLKQMIRQLHIRDPVLHVMSVLGKKYPLNEEEFFRAKLPGNFDLQRAGRRMKLPIPETWETLLSAKGNKAATWEELIDHKKLPFMAMLRNLRNLILTGVSYKHHSWAVSKLNNEKTIASSRQFPFAFFSAYEAINVDLEKLKEEIKEAKEALKNPEAAKAAREKKKAAQPKTPANPDDPVRRAKKVIIPVVMPDAGLIKKYRDALDQAVKFATVHNVKPIRGSTVVFCNVGANVRVKCNTAKGMGGVRYELDSLLSLL